MLKTATTLVGILKEEIEECFEEMKITVSLEHRQYFKGRRSAFQEILAIVEAKE
jgi:hypothetical protein